MNKLGMRVTGNQIQKKPQVLEMLLLIKNEF